MATSSSWHRIVLVGLALIWGLVSCTGTEAQSGRTEYTLPLPATARTNAALTPPTVYLETHPSTVDDTYLSNPGIGWQRGSNPQGLVDLPETVAYAVRSTIAWAVLNPAEGVYDWSVLDSELEQAISAGEQFSFRVYTMAGEGFGGQRIPGWVRTEGATLQSSGEPDYSNCVYQQRWGDFVNALIQRYDGNPNIAFIDISGYGSFNEWDWGDETEWDPAWKDAFTTGTPGPWAFQTLDGQARRRLADMFIGGTFARHECRAQNGQIESVDYAYDGFRKTQLVMPFAGINQSTQYVRARRIDVGFRYDCLGRQKDEQLVIQAAGDTWRHAPVVFELCDPSYYTTESAQAVSQQTHASLIHDNGSELDVQTLANLLQNVGYKYVLQSAKLSGTVQAGSTLSLSMVWHNVGLAPAYPKMGQDFRLHVYLVAGTGQGTPVDELVSADIATWMPADSPGGKPPDNSILAELKIPSSLESGTYEVKVAILDQRTGQPIQLGLKDPDGEGRYLVANSYITQ
ncbi:MAG TPA: DUF4832 domain-containing protein [Anaerolineales bacterium]